MIDPLSIAGLSLAAFDQLLKLGERTFELIQDARAFDDETRRLANKIKDENIRTRLLRNLLFTDLPIYGNNTLIEQFDSDIQKQIQLLLGPLKGVLQEGCDLLERRYGVGGEPSAGLVSQTSNLSIASTLTPGRHSPLQRSKSPSIPDYIRWSFQDKKRVKAIVQELGDQNNRVHEKIKLWCLASQLGVNVQHLQRLQQDTISQQLGFDVDATLRLTQWDAANSQTSLELTDPSWSNYLKTITPVPYQGKFATFTKDGMAYIQEGHDYEAEARSPSDVLGDRTRKKVDELAKLLQQPKEQVFRIPRCVGWKFMPWQNSIGFVFEMPSNPDAEPISLLRLLSSPDVKPELGDKFRLALNLARCISQLHMVKWVHESFRSENILFFPSPKSEVDLTSPWVLGFNFSRPESFFSAGPANFVPAENIYRHPERQGEPERMFSKIHDIYALGVVLLEIGLWEPAIKLEKNMFAHARDNYAIQSQLIKHANKRLESRVGKKYRDAVVKCLTGQFDIVDDTKEDLKLQQAFRTQVVDVFEMAANFV